MFHRYSECARRTLFFARYEAAQLGAHAIALEHLLLGVLRELNGDRGRLFEYEPQSREFLRSHIADSHPVTQRPDASFELPFSAQARVAFETAADEADALGHATIGRVHLLLGLLRESELAAGWFDEHGWTRESVRAALAKNTSVDSLLE